MTDLNEALIASKRHNQDRKLHNCRFPKLPQCTFSDLKLIINLLLLLNFLQHAYHTRFFLFILIHLYHHIILSLSNFLQLLLEKLPQLFLTPMMLICQFSFYHIKHYIKFIYCFVITAEKFITNIPELFAYFF